jgi:replication-associated recombination protein RarA
MVVERSIGWLGENDDGLFYGDPTDVFRYLRMLEGGEDPLYVARRLIVVASEDVGLADPHGLPLVRH